MRQGIASLPYVAALAVLSAAASLHAQCTPVVHPVSQAAVFPNLVAGPIATDGTRVALAKSDGASGTPAIDFQFLDANLNPTTADRQVAFTSGKGAAALFFADTANEFGLFYQRPDATMVLQRIDKSGAPIGNPIVIPHSWSFNDEFDITWDHGAGAYAIAHFVSGGADAGLWLTMVSPAGSTISDVQVSVFLARPANARVAALPNGAAAVLWTASSQATFVSIVNGGSIGSSTEITEQQVLSARIAANNSSILVIYQAPKNGGGTQLRAAQVSTSGGVTSPDSLYLNGRGVDIAPLSLQWIPALSEWALVYSDAIIGFNNFPGEVHLRRFQTLSGPASDTFLSPDATFNLLNAPYPIIFLNNGYVGSISRSVANTSGLDSYVVRFCPLIASFTTDSAVARAHSPITFRASASGGTPGYTYSWSFGDSDSGAGAVVQHQFSANGTYTVTLTATDSFGATAVYKSTILITDQARGRAARH